MTEKTEQKDPVIAAIQMASGPQVSANLIEAERLLEEARAAGACLAVLPENFAMLGQTDEERLQEAESDGDGPLQTWLADRARRLDMWIVGGTIPLAAGAGRVSGACLVYDDTGERRARFDKMHLFDVTLPDGRERYRESDSTRPGDEVVVIDSPVGRLGLAVCYDLRFPELFRAMTDQGAEVFAVPSAFTVQTGRAHWELLLRARAVENLAYVAAGAQGGFHVSGRETWGHSMIVEPWGSVVAERKQGAGVVTAPISLERLRTLRESFPVLEHRRRTGA
ncbi:carbon-nitrogen hydrolase family protein [Natronospira bacteriovora]|uniref:Carbon-nitrogen hydrolase family protein n=1 Tax=Natronospira bacteriovora TaxID=3069753 RepID=A0ABU0W7F0_9GAMM|nr:carbon-nitrogen hydrolase family protein [Natronospira sp. AB-CW4]MDQ2069956.1 carbon-nitrogen hydrolase family protein [Natronospira sp. AB-CW4]